MTIEEVVIRGIQSCCAKITAGSYVPGFGGIFLFDITSVYYVFLSSHWQNMSLSWESWYSQDQTIVVSPQPEVEPCNSSQGVEFVDDSLKSP